MPILSSQKNEPETSVLLKNAIRFSKYCLPVEIFENCCQSSSICHMSINSSFFLSDLPCPPFFSQNTLFVTNHGHGLCFHCGAKPFFLCNLKKKTYFFASRAVAICPFFSECSNKKRMPYSNWEKNALLENLHFIFQRPQLSILSKEAKSGATKSYKIVHSRNCVRCPYYLAKKMNRRHLFF